MNVIYLTENLEDNITRLEKEIDPTNPDKDKKPEVEYKYIKVKVFIEDISQNRCEEIQIEEPKLLYSLIGPANSFYFAFDVDYYKKLTKFMNFLFETEEGTLIYGRFSVLLNPQKYFDIKSKLLELKKNNNVTKIEWELE
mgnify:FL=1